MANEVCFRTLKYDTPWSLESYLKEEGYQAWKKVLAERTQPDGEGQPDPELVFREERYPAGLGRRERHPKRGGDQPRDRAHHQGLGQDVPSLDLIGPQAEAGFVLHDSLIHPLCQPSQVAARHGFEP